MTWNSDSTTTSVSRKNGARKDELLMEYAMQGITNQLFAARYQLYLPKREELQLQLDIILEQMKD